MEIFVFDPDQQDASKKLVKQDLYDLIKTLGTHVEKCLDQNPPVPDREAYVACAQLLEIIDKLGDPGRLNYARDTNALTGKAGKDEIIVWNKVNSDIYRFWDKEPAKRAELSATKEGAAESLRDRLRDKLLNRGVVIFDPKGGDLDGLHNDYRAKWNEVHGVIAEQGRENKATSRTDHLRHKGLT